MTDRGGVDAARALLRRAIDSRLAPAAVAEVGDSRGMRWREAFGRLTFDAAAAAATPDTIFDLASLTKPLATTGIALRLVDSGALDLREPVATFFNEWRGEDREQATIRDLLEHSSGLAARLLGAAPEKRREFEHDICMMPLEYPPRTKSIYSDLGFILLGFALEARGRQPLDAQFDAIVPDRDDEWLAFGTPQGETGRTAPTIPLNEDVRRGRLLVGEVHDNYAAALGGVAAHAGLFGTAGGVGLYARAVLRAIRGDSALPAPFSQALLRQAVTKSTVAGSSRALGWDTMLTTSSCGTRLTPSAFGHVGFTGTSLWIDPERDRYFVLLTNRVCGGGTIEEMRDVRRAFHDSLADA
jgi:serine-type D-Ala-D-Ala carboxypeptidase